MIQFAKIPREREVMGISNGQFHLLLQHEKQVYKEQARETYQKVKWISAQDLQRDMNKP